MIERFSGPHAGQVSSSIERVLRRQVEVELIGRSEVAARLRRWGLKLGSTGSYAVFARQLGIGAFVHGEVRKGRHYRVELSVRQGQDGQIIGRHTFRAKRVKHLRRAGRAFWVHLGNKVRYASPAPRSARAELGDDNPLERAEAEYVSDEALSARPGAGQETQDESGAHPSLLRRVFGKSMSKHEKARQARLESSAGQRLEVSFGAVAFWRFLSYADAFRAVPRAYANPPLSPGLGAALAVRYFLFAGLGVHAGGRSSLGLTTKDAIDGHFATRAYQLLSGLMLRLPVSGLYLLLRADYGYQAFSLRGAAYTPELPSVAYQFVRGGIDSRLRLLDDLTLDVEAAYLYLIDVGDLGSSDYFPNVAGAAVEGLLGLRRPLLEHMSVRLGLSYRRYFFAFHPRPDHQRIVGGALDQFLTVTVSAIYHH